MDLEFYQCFQLNEEECDIVKEYTEKFLKNDLKEEDINNKEYKCEILEKKFEEMDGRITMWKIYSRWTYDRNNV